MKSMSMVSDILPRPWQPT